MTRRVLLLIALLTPARTLVAQGWWDAGGGPYHNGADSAEVNGATLSFSRWKGEERTLQHGFRVAYFRRFQDERTFTPPPPTIYTYVIEEWSGWALLVGMPVRLAPATGVFRPFAEVVPSVALFRSMHDSRFYGGPEDRVGLDDESKWMIGPTVELAAGVMFPAVGRVPRLNARAGYRLGWLAGGPGVGTSAGGGWSGWALTGGVSFPY